MFQLNDTHPIMAIPELMRLLMDEHNYGWDEAYEICQKCFAFTNHTVMAEALEKWPIDYLEKAVPQFTVIATLCHQMNSSEYIKEHTLRRSCWQVEFGRNFSF